MKGAFIRILVVDTKVRLEIKYVVLFPYFLIYVLVPIQCISVYWTVAAHLIFSSYRGYLQNPFKVPEITVRDG